MEYVYFDKVTDNIRNFMDGSWMYIQSVISSFVSFSIGQKSVDQIQRAIFLMWDWGVKLDDEFGRRGGGGRCL